jgi:DNA-damage-inducible protein D
METTLISKLFSSFEDIKHTDESGVEYWSARDLQKLLTYKEWRNFEVVLDKAMEACRKAGNSKFDHFVGVNKMITAGKEAEREIFDIHLTRYAAYLVAQNGDPRKQEIAFAQAYFAVQTRKQELVEKKLLDFERLHVREKLTQTEKELTGLAFERGVDGAGMAKIRSRGDATLFGGHSTKSMKQKLAIAEDRTLADFLPTVLLKAKDLAAEVTNHNIRENKSLHGEEAISHEHTKNNQGVRDFLLKSGIVPENLPPATDIQKIKRQQEAEAKKLADEK